MKLRRSRVKSTGYASSKTIPVLGRVKLVLKNNKDLRVKAMAYVIKDAKESQDQD